MYMKRPAIVGKTEELEAHAIAKVNAETIKNSKYVKKT